MQGYNSLWCLYDQVQLLKLWVSIWNLEAVYTTPFSTKNLKLYAFCRLFTRQHCFNANFWKCILKYKFLKKVSMQTTKAWISEDDGIMQMCSIYNVSPSSNALALLRPPLDWSKFTLYRQTILFTITKIISHQKGLQHCHIKCILHKTSLDAINGQWI